MSNHNNSSSGQDRITGERRPVPRSAVVLRHSHAQTQTHTQPPRSPLTSARQMTPSKPGLFFRMKSDSNLLHNRRMAGEEGVNRNRKETPREKIWNVEQIEEIDPFFPIERSHEVIDDLAPSQIAINVYNFLVAQSIDAVYDDQEAVAYAQTPKGCKFRVHLFKPNHHFNGGNKDGSVLVEVQRRSGCCVKFHSLAMQILCAAKGCEYQPECPHYTIDTHKELECADCDLFDGNTASARANFLQEAAY